jgi:hypothetical protein
VVYVGSNRRESLLCLQMANRGVCVGLNVEKVNHGSR